MLIVSSGVPSVVDRAREHVGDPDRSDGERKQPEEKLGDPNGGRSLPAHRASLHRRGSESVQDRFSNDRGACGKRP